jgi:hypothetical protein
MKLKEKLARDYSMNQKNCMDGFVPMGHTGDAFLAGFEAARAMAQSHFIDNVMVSPLAEFPPPDLNWVSVNGEHFKFTLLDDFNRMGEQEV